ncbi:MULTISPECIES: ACP S-malonyltransferase [Paenibacillus]|uniref:[acyl-carrier-protein] S-malonyltransferase n=1 Tax=Paenibacillus cucumis (ex Kampfer et al. 2016) TaxID=1776858 RepID=A0ABS7KSY4_9BACL|nr:ACP S-malonyltransferase [Paenibacillus cucumis (ex Kampfer et al. 2016)]MBY0207121.1 ACP S-malonyltransferase [Paenibacillus cucumis (ex Kampfer et al. 2016)]MDP9698978.1 [acyl-carrier-protein] S-malonyltransferase [Paenibacillus intestini]
MKKSAFIFPGQGTQYVGMGKTLHDQFSSARETFEEANDVTGIDITKLCFEGSLLKLSQIDMAQLAIVTASVAAYRVLKEELELEPDYVAGHSLGEYSALVASGVISFKDALKLLQLRGELCFPYCNSGKGSMSIIDHVQSGLIENICSKVSSVGCQVSIACYNAPLQTVITGDAKAVMEAEDAAVMLGGGVTPLMMSGPFHSPILQPVANLMERELKDLKVSNFSFPVMSNVTGLPYTTPESVRELLLSHLTHPVKWMDILHYLSINNIDVMVEVGPQHILTNLLKLNDAPFSTYSFGIANELPSLSALKPKKYSDIEFMAQCLKAAVTTRNRNLDESAFESAIEAYTELEQIDREVNLHRNILSNKQRERAIQLLTQVLVNKQVPLNEREMTLGKLLCQD